MTSSLAIRAEHLTIVQKILRKHFSKNTTVWVFGSRAKGTARKFSDLDLAVDAGVPLPITLLANLVNEFDESNLPYKVDIVDWVTASESFKKMVADDRVVIWKKKDLKI